MAGIKISALPTVTASLLTDVFPAVQTGVTSQETLQQVLTLFNANISIAESQVVNLVTDLAAKLNLSGGTMTGNLILNADPTAALGAATKQYADSIAAGLNPIPGVVAASTGALTVTYANGTAGVGATLTNATTQAIFTLDGQTPAAGSRVLIKDQASSLQNGIYNVTNVGSVSTNWVLTRATDYDTPGEIEPGDLIIIEAGTVNAGASYVQTATVAVIGTDAITFSAFFLPSNFVSSTLTSAHILVGNGSNVATNVAVSGDLTAANTGAFTVVSATSPKITTSLKDANGNTWIGQTATASAVNYVDIKDNSTTNAPAVSAKGSDTNILLQLNGQGNKGVGTQGSTAGSTAVAGNVGEVIKSIIASGSAVNFANTIPTDLTSISLTAGNWLVFGNITVTFTGNSGAWVGWTSTSSVSVPDGSLFTAITSTESASCTQGIAVPTLVYSFSSTTTVYISAEAQFTSGAASGYGGIYAVRLP